MLDGGFDVEGRRARTAYGLMLRRRNHLRKSHRPLAPVEAGI